MDCSTAAWVSVIGGVIELLGILTVAADLLYTGRVPDVRGVARKLLGRPPGVVLASSQLNQAISLRDSGRAGAEVLRPAVDTGDVAGQLHELERRIEEVRAEGEREVRSLAEAMARLERSIQDQLQSLQNEITGLRRDLTADRARATSRPWIPWAGVAAFVFGLALNTFGTFMSARCM